jgi:hypothetical protein
MVIPLTPEAPILREKKNKRKTMMNNIKNTMCRLSELSKWQIDNLVDAMPNSCFFDFAGEEFIGATPAKSWGTWDARDYKPTIVTYTEMMQLLGKDMNKQTAQEQMAVMQIEMDKLKAIIDRPEAKTGRVLVGGDMNCNDRYYLCIGSVAVLSFSNDTLDRRYIEAGVAFHDKETAERHLKYLKLEQELRRAQIADGGAGGDLVIVIQDNRVVNSHSVYFHKVSFRTVEARNNFRNTHTDEQLTLLIRGV